MPLFQNSIVVAIVTLSVIVAITFFIRRRGRHRKVVIIDSAGQGGAQLAEALCGGDDDLSVVSVDWQAVHLTNVMGATKCFAELILQDFDHKSTSMRCCMVRFGNVP